jgi:hypothetical protein
MLETAEPRSHRGDPPVFSRLTPEGQVPVLEGVLVVPSARRLGQMSPFDESSTIITRRLSWYRCRSRTPRRWPACSAIHGSTSSSAVSPRRSPRCASVTPVSSPARPTLMRCGSTGSSAAVRTSSRSARSGDPHDQARTVHCKRGVGHRSGLAEAEVRVRGCSSADRVVATGRCRRRHRLHPSRASGVGRGRHTSRATTDPRAKRWRTGLASIRWASRSCVGPQRSTVEDGPQILTVPLG